MGCSSSAAVCVSGSTTKHTGFHESYFVGKKLGEGAFGQVRVAKRRSSNTDLAVKIIDVRKRSQWDETLAATDPRLAENAKAESRAWTQVGSHPNCVCLLADYLDHGLFYMVMEKCDCTLMDKLVSAEEFSEQDLQRIFREMLLGICHVHKMGIVHRDIKLENFLYSGNTLKLCDFGLAAKLPKKGLIKGVFGTAPYMCPEMIKGEGYDEKCDVWSFGVCAYLVLFTDFPYLPAEKTSASMKKAILKGDPPPSYTDSSGKEAASGDAAAFVKALLERSRTLRKDSQEALELTFLTRSSKKVSLNSAHLKRALNKAVTLTIELREPVDNRIKKTGLDELLARLQAKHGVSIPDGLSKNLTFFSEEPHTEQQPELAHVRSETRHSTHSGAISNKPSDISTVHSNSWSRKLSSNDPSPASTHSVKKGKSLRDIPSHGDDGIAGDEYFCSKV